MNDDLTREFSLRKQTAQASEESLADFGGPASSSFEEDFECFDFAVVQPNAVALRASVDNALGAVFLLFAFHLSVATWAVDWRILLGQSNCIGLIN
ncbi:hypothetical protein K239x_47750 [Planctomycetes bacterium K23_9]|uniref:Uncharacterized protein n=1 Tax=Stieleria marina TaxID=1930275 RepID=A0A517P064_9BACT|nr:hypothetical protein K239x_47750 [Planctomycetes bacterium K23_9]